MKVFEKVTETVTQTRFVAMACDKCSRESRNEEWTDKSYYTDEITIERRYGNQWPDGADIDCIQYDICPDCFKKYIQDGVFKDVKPRITNVDY